MVKFFKLKFDKEFNSYKQQKIQFSLIDKNLNIGLTLISELFGFHFVILIVKTHAINYISMVINLFRKMSGFRILPSPFNFYIF